MKKSKSNEPSRCIQGRMGQVQKSHFDTISRAIPGVIIYAFIFALIGLLEGCVDMGGLNTESEISQLRETMMSKKVKSMPGPPQLLTSGLQGATGSTIGPGGALFVTEWAEGTISRIDPETGAVTTFASGLPVFTDFGGGVYDVAFIGGTAYALVTLVGSDIGGSDVVGIYRIDGPTSYTVIADIGAFASANPPNTSFFVPTGVQFAIQTYRGGFLVTDGHHNRVLNVTTDGEISVFKTFGNIVPTGLALSGNTIYMAEAGPVPHLPEDGKIVSFSPNSPSISTVATGARLLVDVEFSRGRTLFALAQGFFTPGSDEGSPADPNTGSLVKVNADGTFTVAADGLDRPISLEFIGNTAYILTLTGEVLTIENASGPPFGK